MTLSAPRSSTKSCFSCLATAITQAPSDFAIWTAKWPTPPAAPLIRTFVPGPTLATSTSICQVPEDRTGDWPSFKPSANVRLIIDVSVRDSARRVRHLHQHGFLPHFSFLCADGSARAPGGGVRNVTAMGFGDKHGLSERWRSSSHRQREICPSVTASAPTCSDNRLNGIARSPATSLCALSVL
jgi:hypothetical protein